jgi:hypothetical protein
MPRRRGAGAQSPQDQMHRQLAGEKSLVETWGPRRGGPRPGRFRPGRPAGPGPSCRARPRPTGDSDGSPGGVPDFKLPKSRTDPPSESTVGPGGPRPRFTSWDDSDRGWGTDLRQASTWPAGSRSCAAPPPPASTVDSESADAARLGLGIMMSRWRASSSCPLQVSATGSAQRHRDSGSGRELVKCHRQCTAAQRQWPGANNLVKA